MKKFLIKLLIYCIVFTAFPAMICAVADPYNVMHPLSIRNNGVEPNKNYIKMTYILNNPEKFDSFVFGSSRVGNIHVENIPGERCYNMTYSYGSPDQHLDNIRTFVENKVIPERIYIGVDSLSYTTDPSDSMVGYRMPYEYLTENPLVFLKTYLDPAVVGRAVISVEKKTDESAEAYSECFYEYGWNKDYNYKTSYDFSNVKPFIGKSMRINETLDNIAEIVKICNENGIDLVIFTNPLHPSSYEASLELDYLYFLGELAKITPYYNFSGYNDIVTDNSNFIDNSHYTAEVSDMLIECMCNGKKYDGLYEQGFGMYVTEDNADDFIALLEGQI